MPTTVKTSFSGHDGRPLDARLELPDGAPVGFAVFAHCFACSKDSIAASRISRELTTHGLAVLRFDFAIAGGDADGRAAAFSCNVEDLVLAANHLRTTHQAPALLLGHSLGGAAAIAAAPRIPEVRAVATINAPADPAHLKNLLTPALEQIRAEGEAEVTLGQRRIRISRQFVDDLQDQRLDQTLRELGKALMVMHAPTDAVVGVDNARRLFEAARHPKSFVSLDGADHLLTRKEDAAFVAAVLGAWVTRYLDTPPAPPQVVLPEVGWVEVGETGEGKYTQRIRIGKHLLVADEPESFGGADLGPSPYDLLTAGLGACTAMTVRMYAARKGWPLERVSVRLRHRKIHAQDCADCETTTGKIDHLSRELVLEGPLDSEMRARLLEIADRCPVHRTLESEVKVQTVLAETSGGQPAAR